MYGSIFRMKPKKGKEKALLDMMTEWEKVRRPKVKGSIAGYMMRPDNKPGEIVGIAVFIDKKAYRVNAEDPEQHKWYLKMRELLDADPVWEDGEYVAGGSGSK